MEQFIKSILSYFMKIEPMSAAYAQKIPTDVKYPCYLLNKVDTSTTTLNSFFFINNVHLYIRAFDKDELELKNKVLNLVNTIFEQQRKIPILDENGLPHDRFIRVENIETIEINVDENEVYCIEINFSFDTTQNISRLEYELLSNVILQ